MCSQITEAQLSDEGPLIEATKSETQTEEGSSETVVVGNNSEATVSGVADIEPGSTLSERVSVTASGEQSVPSVAAEAASSGALREADPETATVEQDITSETVSSGALREASPLTEPVQPCAPIFVEEAISGPLYPQLDSLVRGTVQTDDIDRIAMSKNCLSPLGSYW